MSYTQIYKQVFNSTFSELLDIKDYVINNIQNDKAKEILLEDEITIKVDLNDGEFAATAYGCDLTYEYVKINGDYRTWPYIPPSDEGGGTP